MDLFSFDNTSYISNNINVQSPSLSLSLWLSQLILEIRSRYMSEDPPLIRCPSCGSLLTSPLNGTGMWECRYHLCRAIFPAIASRELHQTLLITERDELHLGDRKR